MMQIAMTQESHLACPPGESRRYIPAAKDLANINNANISSAWPGAPSGQGPSLAAAYLDQYNEMVALIERLPGMPELIDDLLNWNPTSYHDYFAASAMPGRASAADVYASLNRCLRQRFEGFFVDLDRKTLGAVAAIRRHYKTHGEARPDIMADLCARAGTRLREALGRATALVNHVSGDITPTSKAQISQA